MGDFAGVSWGEEKHPGCSFCGMKTKSCCHDDVKIIKSADFAYPANAVVLASQCLQASIFPTLTILPDCSKVYPSKCSHSNFTFREGPPLYLKNCVFRI
jgi:hypothetical protein